MYGRSRVGPSVPASPPRERPAAPPAAILLLKLFHISRLSFREKIHSSYLCSFIAIAKKSPIIPALWTFILREPEAQYECPLVRSIAYLPHHVEARLQLSKSAQYRRANGNTHAAMHVKARLAPASRHAVKQHSPQPQHPRAHVPRSRRQRAWCRHRPAHAPAASGRGVVVAHRHGEDTCDDVGVAYLPTGAP